MIYHRLETKTDLVAAVGVAMTFFLYFCSPGYHPWYIVWCLPFAALSNSRWLMVGAVAFTLTAFLPILALNWQITLGDAWHIRKPVEWSTALMWLARARLRRRNPSHRTSPRRTPPQRPRRSAPA